MKLSANPFTRALQAKQNQIGLWISLSNNYADDYDQIIMLESLFYCYFKSAGGFSSSHPPDPLSGILIKPQYLWLSNARVPPSHR